MISNHLIINTNSHTTEYELYFRKGYGGGILYVVQDLQEHSLDEIKEVFKTLTKRSQELAYLKMRIGAKQTMLGLKESYRHRQHISLADVVPVLDNPCSVHEPFLPI